MRCMCEKAALEARLKALEEAAKLMDAWADECDPDDYDERELLFSFRLAAERVRALKADKK